MELQTQRLLLRNYKESDFEDYWDYVSMPNVGPRSGWAAYTDKEKAKQRLDLEISKPHQFAIVLKQENKVIGSVELLEHNKTRYTNLHLEPDAKEIGFILSEKYWGKGIMPEACKVVMRYAFETLGVNQIVIGHLKANTNSGRVQDKLGFNIVGELPNFENWIDGKPTSYIQRLMTKKQWQDINKKHD